MVKNFTQVDLNSPQMSLKSLKNNTSMFLMFTQGTLTIVTLHITQIGALMITEMKH